MRLVKDTLPGLSPGASPRPPPSLLGGELGGLLRPVGAEDLWLTGARVGGAADGPVGPSHSSGTRRAEAGGVGGRYLASDAHGRNDTMHMIICMLSTMTLLKLRSTSRDQVNSPGLQGGREASV
jgi:hypothetical protein